MIQEKPLPLERLTTRSFYDGAPYRQLQMLVINQDIREWYSRFVLKTQTVRSYSQIVQQDAQSMRYSDCKVAIDFARHHLTHLDPVVFRDDNVPLELFVDYDKWIKPFAREARALKEQNELREEHELVGIAATTHYCHTDGPNTVLEVKVVDFDAAQARFLVRNDELGVVAWRSRLFLRREDDNVQEMEAAKLECLQLKAEALHYLRVQRLINDDMTKRYHYLRLSNDVLQRIQRRIYVDLSSTTLIR